MTTIKDMFENNISASWEWIKLKEVCEINPRRNPTSNIDGNTKLPLFRCLGI